MDVLGSLSVKETETIKDYERIVAAVDLALRNYLRRNGPLFY
jgi:hypothetical protein